MWSFRSLFLPVFLLVVLLLPDEILSAIQCYDCDSSRNFTCTEFWDPSLVVTEKYLTNCEHVFEANYCVKMTGIFDGKLGTKRFCSSRNWGNYCEYIKRPGDIQEYRSCVFTCSTHGCNGAGNPGSSWTLVLISLGLLQGFRIMS